jgi:hypothetical protein
MRATSSNFVTRRSLCRLRKILLLLALLAACATPSVFAERPTTLGVILAAPTSQTLSAAAIRQYWLPHELRIPILFSVDTGGAVRSIKPEFPDDTTVVRFLDSALRAVTFVAGRRGEVSDSQIVRAQLFVFPGAISAKLVTPVDDSGHVTDQDLYVGVLRDNGVKIPAIKSLAPFPFTMKRRDTITRLPLVLLKVSIDATGKLTDIQTVCSTIPGLTSQMMSVFTWATFTPAMVGKRSVPADSWVVVAFHPEARYPTRPIGAPSKDTASYIETQLLRVIADTTGAMIPPLPVHLNAREFRIDEALGRQLGLISLNCLVDTSGVPVLSRLSNSTKLANSLCMSVLSKVRFYPALDAHGHPIKFSGIIYMLFNGSANIRVQYDWLIDPLQMPPR